MLRIESKAPLDHPKINIPIYSSKYGWHCLNVNKLLLNCGLHKVIVGFNLIQICIHTPSSNINSFIHTCMYVLAKTLV